MPCLDSGIGLALEEIDIMREGNMVEFYMLRALQGSIAILLTLTQETNNLMSEA